MGRLSLLLVACILFVASGCRQEPKEFDNPRVIQRSGSIPEVIEVAEDDPEMVAAIEKARSTVDEFIAAMQAPSPSQENFSVKLLVEEGEIGEHMWLSDLKLNGDRFVGVLNNDPESLKNVQFGSELSVPKDEISDWMYIDNGLIVGGQSIRLLIERSPPAQREAMSKALKFAVE